MKRSMFGLLGVLAAYPGFAAAETSFSATNLQTLCTNPGGVETCDSFFLGFTYGVISQHVANGQICFPTGLAPLQAKLVVEKYMRDHPEQLHADAVLITNAALTLAFPCPKSN
jgi:hypothetical protein